MNRIFKKESSFPSQFLTTTSSAATTSNKSPSKENRRSFKVKILHYLLWNTMGCGTYRHTKAHSRYFWNTISMWWPCGQIFPPTPHNSSKIMRINPFLGSISAGITDSSPISCKIMRLIIAGDWILWWNKGHRSAILSLTMPKMNHCLCKI